MLLTGPVDPLWGELFAPFPSFVTLDLSSAGLNGSLPGEWGGSFRQLQTLILDNNSFQALPLAGGAPHCKQTPPMGHWPVHGGDWS